MEQKLSVERKKKISPHGEDVPLPLGLPNTLGRYSHDLQAPGFEPRWVASQLEALPTAGQFSTITYQQMDNHGNKRSTSLQVKPSYDIVANMCMPVDISMEL